MGQLDDIPAYEQPDTITIARVNTLTGDVHYMGTLILKEGEC